MTATDGTNRSTFAALAARGLVSYLAAMVLVPVSIVVLLATDLVIDQAHSYGRAQEVVDQLQRLTDLSRFRFSVARERSLVTTMTDGHALGYNDTTVSLALGTDLRKALADAGGQADAAAGPVNGDPELQELFARATEVRQDKLSRTHALDGDTSSARYAELERAVRERSAEQLRIARRLAEDVSGSGRLQLAIAALDESLRLHDAHASQSMELVEELRAPTLDEVEQARIRLAKATGQADLSLQRLTALLDADSPAGVALAELQASEGYQDVRTAVDNALAVAMAPADTGFDIRVWTLAPAFRGLQELAELDAAVVAATIADASRQSGELGAAARLDALLTVFVALAAVAVTAGVVAAIVRSLRRPLGQLEATALRMLSGSGDSDPVREAGPREVRVVTRAVNEFAANLAQIERQADALARADLDDEALAEPATGSIGRSLRAAFGRLGAAMQEQASMRSRLAHDASHDPLTGLLNRAAALRAVAEALARASRSGTRAAVLFIDLDGFKQVNDLHGHAVGDEVLRQVVARLQRVSRAGDAVARLGGDEFLIIVEQLVDVAEAARIGERIVASLAEAIRIGPLVVTIGASVGIAEGDRSEDGEIIVADADLAVYQAKAAGKGQVQRYHAGLRNELARRSELERDLRRALHDDALELHFQPVADAEGAAVRSVEALLRWDRPGHGPVPPAVFIPVAEESALINDIGRWVLRRACRQLAVWSSEADLAAVSVAVNISARHLMSPSLVADVRSALDGAGVRGAQLIVEVTETALLSDLDAAARHLGELRAMGVRIALDDFGTGHTSFTQLRHLPIDSIKIDRSYIAALADPDQRALTRIMTDIARVLGVDVVAEGVERDDQLDAVSELGCESAQGFLICPPLPIDDVTAWLRRHGRGAVSPAAGEGERSA